MSRRGVCVSALLLGLSGCAAQSFDPHFKAREIPSERTVLQQIQKAEPRDERPVAVGISEAPQRLCAWDLRGGLLWERPIAAKSAPLVVGNAVVTAEAEGIVVRDLERGESRAVVDDEGQLVGADGAGSALVIAIAYPEEKKGPRGAIAYVKDFRVQWKQSLKLPVGVPALVGQRVLVPWATQRLSVLDTEDGGELVRWHMNDTVLGHALVDRGRVYVGQHGLLKLDGRLLQAGGKPTVYVPFQRSLPGQPPLLRDGYLPLPAPDNAYHKVQLDFRIGEGDTLSAQNDLLALRFYRLLFALDARSDQIRWTRSFEHDLIGSAIQPGGLFIADSHGTLRFIDAEGTTRLQSELGRPLQVLAIRPGTFVPGPAAPAAAPATGAASAEPPPAGAGASAAEPAAVSAPEGVTGSLTEQLYAAAALPDDRLSAGRAYAVEHLARAPDAAVTSQLIGLCSDAKSPEPVRMRACSELSKREQGGDQVLQALRNRASFLEDRPAPPLSALAEAAARMRLKEAAPLLIGHMEDPNTPVPALVAVLETLERLEHRPAATAIERFVRLHHAEPEGSELAPALLAAVHALGSLRAKPARPTLDDIARDGLTASAVRERAREAIGLMDAPPAPPAGSAPPKAAPEPETVEETEDVQTEPQAYALTTDVVREALAPLRRRIGACLNADPAKPRSARVSMVVHGEGRLEGVFVTPTTLQACIEPVLHDARFPATRAGRQRITQVVYGANAEQTVKPPAAPKPTPAKKSAARTAK